MEEATTNFVLGLVSGVASSLATIWVLRFFLRPRLKICSSIADCYLDGRQYYMFKIINLTGRPIIDVRVRCHLERPAPELTGESKILRRIWLVTEEILMLGGYQGDEADNNFFFRIRTSCDKNEIPVGDLFKRWPDAVLRFRVLLRDPISQVETVETRYFKSTDVSAGMFGPGSDCSVTEKNFTKSHMFLEETKG